MLRKNFTGIKLKNDLFLLNISHNTNSRNKNNMKLEDKINIFVEVSE